MPVPQTGALALPNLQAEFGGANAISMSEYYADTIWEGSFSLASATSNVEIRLFCQI